MDPLWPWSSLETIAVPPAGCSEYCIHFDSSRSRRPHPMRSACEFSAEDPCSKRAWCGGGSADADHDTTGLEHSSVNWNPPSPWWSAAAVASVSVAQVAGSWSWQWQVLWISHLRPQWFLRMKGENKKTVSQSGPNGK